MHILNTDKLHAQTHIHNQGLVMCLGQPHNDTWHVWDIGDMGVGRRLWNRAGGFWLHLSNFRTCCIVLRAEISCKHSETHQKHVTSQRKMWVRISMSKAWNKTPGNSRTLCVETSQPDENLSSIHICEEKCIIIFRSKTVTQPDINGKTPGSELVRLPSLHTSTMSFLNNECV